MATNKRVIVISSAVRTANDLQAVLNSNRNTHVRSESSVSGESVTGVVEKPKRKRQRLDHLSPDEKIMRRKLKNRMAAQTARDRKKMKMNDLESEVTRLAQSNEQLVKNNIRLENRLKEIEKENKLLKAKLHKLDTTEEDTSSGDIEPEENGSSSQAMMNLLDELSDDMDLELNDLLKLDDSDIASDDSGYLFSDHSSRGNISNSVNSNATLSGNATLNGAVNGNSSLSSLAVNINALESAAFINDPQQQEQVLVLDDQTPVKMETVKHVPKSMDTQSETVSASVMPEAWEIPQTSRLLSLVKIAKQELAILSSSQTAPKQAATTISIQKENSMKMKSNQKIVEAKLSYNCRLKIFLIFLHLLCLKGMTSSPKANTKSSLMTTLLRVSTRLSLWNLNSQSSILESLIRTARMNLEHSIQQTVQAIATREDNIILERFLRSQIAQETPPDSNNNNAALNVH